MKNKENTKQKLLNAVGDIIKNEGFKALGVNKVARTAGVSKILIYRYFGSFTELVRECILDMHFWAKYMSEDEGDPSSPLTVKDRVYKVLTEQAGIIYNHCEMEAILVTEISDGNPVVKDIVREESVPHGQTYCNVVSTLLQAGTDHLILAAQNTGINNQPEISTVKQNKLMKSIGQIVDWTLG
jgi:AcrR family transcriptional regulator